MAQSELGSIIQEDLEKYSSISFPVKTGLLERLLIKKLPCKMLHPNPADEFSFPDIGPNYNIISDYEAKIRRNLAIDKPVYDEPVTVEKVRPHGYMLLNGHHRWAAALHQNIDKIPVEIINLAQESDIKKILENSTHTKRATLDLDEVIIRTDDDPFLEKKPGFLFSLKHKKRIRAGIPALFYHLSRNGYDIWVYSSEYHSIDDVRDFLKGYKAHVDGVITGMSKEKKAVKKQSSEMEKLFSNKYSVTLHIDNDMILRTEKETSDFKEYPLNIDENWAKDAIAYIMEMEKSTNDGKNS
ncbi:MAG: ParB/RepB/Spo0J family partition protein [Lachnospiraceae bacterium]|nr:ParB/RepB/Spo0J family partition protein [Lachnospiraceae bacterium]